MLVSLIPVFIEITCGQVWRDLENQEKIRIDQLQVESTHFFKEVRPTLTIAGSSRPPELAQKAG